MEGQENYGMFESCHDASSYYVGLYDNGVLVEVVDGPMTHDDAVCMVDDYNMLLSPMC